MHCNVASMKLFITFHLVDRMKRKPFLQNYCRIHHIVTFVEIGHNKINISECKEIMLIFSYKFSKEKKYDDSFLMRLNLSQISVVNTSIPCCNGNHTGAVSLMPNCDASLAVGYLPITSSLQHL